MSCRGNIWKHLSNVAFQRCELVLPSPRMTKDTARFKDELDVMKFICKDFWTCVFKKQIDNLRTNHQVPQAGSTGAVRSAAGSIHLYLLLACLPSVDVIVVKSYRFYHVFDSVVDVSGHLRPPGQRVSVAGSAVSRETVSGSGPEGTTAQTSGGPSAFFVSSVCGGEPTRACLGLQYLAFTCGLVRGALLSLGVKSIVTAEASIMPASKTRCRLHHQGQQHSFFFR